MTESAMNRLTSSMPGMVFTPRRLSVFCNRLSSVEVVLCTAFFFLQGMEQDQRSTWCLLQLHGTHELLQAQHVGR